MNAARYVEVFDREGFKLLEQLGVGLGYTEA
ncbi:MAG: thioesterase, partial [Burkholderiaceae bacterium]